MRWPAGRRCVRLGCEAIEPVLVEFLVLILARMHDARCQDDLPARFMLDNNLMIKSSGYPGLSFAMADCCQDLIFELDAGR